MFNWFFNGIAMLFRMGREFATRQVRNVFAKIRAATSLTTQAAKLTPKALSAMVAAWKKPTRRADYVETKRLLIAKSTLIWVIIALVIVALIVYFWALPTVKRIFMTNEFPVSASSVATYSGKVFLYYDDLMQDIMYNGKLDNGKKVEEGRLYYKNGNVQYDGKFADDLYHGNGKLYDKDVKRLYEGEFLKGIYNGMGTEYANDIKVYYGNFFNGVRQGMGSTYDDMGKETYTGTFDAGLREGKGREYLNGKMIYNGNFSLDKYDGQGSQFDRAGNLNYQGGFVLGERSGQGSEFYPDGTLKYKGEFQDGAYNGQGTLYDQDGNKVYEGGTKLGVFEGEGTLFCAKDEWKQGNFINGELVGNMKWYIAGKLYYEGEARNSLPDGAGVLYNLRGAPVYEGAMRSGMIDGATLLGMSVEDARLAFGKAQLSDTDGNGFFTVINKEAGVTVHCTFQTQKAPPTVYAVYVYADKLNAPDMLNLSSVDFLRAELEKQAQITPMTTLKRKTTISGTPLTQKVSYNKTVYGFDEYSMASYFTQEDRPICLAWEMGKAAAGVSGGAEAAKQPEAASADDDLLGLLKDLSLIS